MADASMLRACEADKAIYEVVYETRNRPDWVDIRYRAVAATSTTATRVRTRLRPRGQQPGTPGRCKPAQEHGELVSPNREQE